MPKRSSKRKSESSDLSSLDDGPQPEKVLKKSNPTATANDGKIDLGGNKFIYIKEFRKKIYVDLREFYEEKSSGELKPTKKGVCLNLEGWSALKNSVEEIDRLLAQQRLSH